MAAEDYPRRAFLRARPAPTALRATPPAISATAAAPSGAGEPDPESASSPVEPPAPWSPPAGPKGGVGAGVGVGVGVGCGTYVFSMVHVTADGEIDAANALELSKFVESELEATSRLIVDLRGLDFFGIQGFSILHRINVMCSRHAVNWVVLPGEEVNRVLHICDPDGGLPVADTLDDAIAAAVRPPRNHLRLVSEA